jgi:hypothetical protein
MATQRPAAPRPDDPAEDSLDEAIDETFPASDPPSNTPQTGVKLTNPDVPDDPREVERETDAPGETDPQRLRVNTPQPE